MNDLERYFYNNTGRLIHKWLHYFDIYDRHFAPFRGKPITLLEFGVYHGGSLAMWKDYFGPQARIVGVDIDPRCAELADDQVEIILGDQDDRSFLRQLWKDLGSVDVLIDDGGHRMTQQIATFEELWPAVVEGGVYLVEDLHTSYWPEYGGGEHDPSSFLSRAKSLIDSIHGWHGRQDVTPDAYTKSIGGMHVYDSVIVFDKANVLPPSHRMRGRPSFPLEEGLEELLDNEPGEGGGT